MHIKMLQDYKGTIGGFAKGKVYDVPKFYTEIFPKGSYTKLTAKEARNVKPDKDAGR